MDTACGRGVPLLHAVQHGALVARRLHTTVEEDAFTKARLCGLSAKLEAAGAEQLQRLDQAKAMNTLQVGLAEAMQGPEVEVGSWKCCSEAATAFATAAC
jgi:hypothetical protein